MPNISTVARLRRELSFVEGAPNFKNDQRANL